MSKGRKVQRGKGKQRTSVANAASEREEGGCGGRYEETADLSIQRALLDLEKWESNLEARIGDEAESRRGTLNTPLSGTRDWVVLKSASHRPLPPFLLHPEPPALLFRRACIYLCTPRPRNTGNGRGGGDEKESKKKAENEKTGKLLSCFSSRGEELSLRNRRLAPLDARGWKK